MKLNMPHLQLVQKRSRNHLNRRDCIKNYEGKGTNDLFTRIGALGGGSANLLVRASGAGIRLPRLLRLRSRAICTTDTQQNQAYKVSHLPSQDDLENRRTWAAESASNPKERGTGGSNRSPREEAASYARWHPPGRRLCCRRSPSLPLPVRRLLLEVPIVGLGLGERGSTELALKPWPTREGIRRPILAGRLGYFGPRVAGLCSLFSFSLFEKRLVCAVVE